MIKQLRLKNVGPATQMKLDFGQRLNLLTGDNGLGKSFLLDIIWWALTRRWPAEINPKLIAGKMAQPTEKSDAEITFSFSSKSKKDHSTVSTFNKKDQTWRTQTGRPPNPGLVLYAMSDGSFAVWDPHRNYWHNRGSNKEQERAPAYVFSPGEVWDGLQSQKDMWLCNGLIRDLSSWQKEKTEPYKTLADVLEVLSPSPDEKLVLGAPTRISLNDVRDIPTIRMPYNQDVAIVHASSGIRRIMALAYLLVWAWEEHKIAAKLIDEAPTNQITFLIDEIESHLHPSWQRTILPALLTVMDKLTQAPELQIITATHSPLIMVSAETQFDESKDAWFDIDMQAGNVLLRKCDFEKQGCSSAWLMSEAFDLKSDRPLADERLVEEANVLLSQATPSKEHIKELYKKLCSVLDPRDDFLFRWRYICSKKGWLS